MRLVVNGTELDAVSSTVEALLEELGYGSALVATALNGEFVTRADRGARTLTDGDRVEIVAPLQGG